MLTSTAMPPAQLTVHPDSGEADDSIAKMASALLDDTTDQERDSSQHSAEYLHQVRHYKTTPNLKGGFCSQVFESPNGSYNSQPIFEARKAQIGALIEACFENPMSQRKSLAAREREL